jgi:hypothetical protein
VLAGNKFFFGAECCVYLAGERRMGFTLHRRLLRNQTCMGDGDEYDGGPFRAKLCIYMIPRCVRRMRVLMHADMNTLEKCAEFLSVNDML